MSLQNPGGVAAEPTEPFSETPEYVPGPDYLGYEASPSESLKSVIETLENVLLASGDSVQVSRLSDLLAMLAEVYYDSEYREDTGLVDYLLRLGISVLDCEVVDNMAVSFAPELAQHYSYMRGESSGVFEKSNMVIESSTKTLLMSPTEKAVMLEGCTGDGLRKGANIDKLLELLNRGYSGDIVLMTDISGIDLSELSRYIKLNKLSVSIRVPINLGPDLGGIVTLGHPAELIGG